ncbi:hypothetical protein KI387_002877, partial [Taxus chinensis]
CAGCTRQRKKCSEKCILAPHFPSSDPHKFEIVHRVFGTNHVLKTLQCVVAEQRADAVNSMVCEASARVQDPIHGITSAVHQMEKKIAELESQLAARQAEVACMRLQRDKLEDFLVNGCNEGGNVLYPSLQNDDLMLDDVDQLWKPTLGGINLRHFDAKKFHSFFKNFSVNT